MELGRSGWNREELGGTGWELGGIWVDLGGTGRNQVELGGTGWNWEELGGIGRKQGESGRNLVDLGRSGWELGGIWVELGGIILSENAIYIYYYNSTHSCSRLQYSCSFQFSMYDMIRKNDSS